MPLGERVSHLLSMRWGQGREGIRAAVRRATLSVGTVRVHGRATRTVESNSNASAMIPNELRLRFPRVVLRAKAVVKTTHLIEIFFRSRGERSEPPSSNFTKMMGHLCYGPQRITATSGLDDDHMVGSSGENGQISL